MKRTAVLAALVALVLAGCSSSDDSSAAEPEPSVDTCATPPEGESVGDYLDRCDGGGRTPEPSEGERASLVAALDSIVPGLAEDPSSAVTKARSTCGAILEASPNLTQATVTRFSGGGAGAVTPEHAHQIIALVSAEPWCA